MQNWGYFKKKGKKAAGVLQTSMEEENKTKDSLLSMGGKNSAERKHRMP